MKTQLILLLLTIIFTSCKKDTISHPIENLERNKIHVIGHGGMGNKSLIPMNTKESIFKAISYRPYGVEMDIQVTKDGVPMLFHDELLEHSTKGVKGKISNVEYKDLKNNKYKSLQGEYIRTLEEIIIETNNLLSIYVLDCKPYSDVPSSTYATSFAYDIYKVINNLGVKDKVFIECQDIYLIKAFQNIDKSLKLFIYTNEFDKSFTIAKEYGLYGITIDMDLISKEQIKKAHDSGIRVSLFDVDTDHRNHTAMKLSPDFIQTDMVKDLVDKLENMNK